MPVGRTLVRRGIRPAPVSAVGAVVYDADAAAYFAAMAVQPADARKSLINNLITGLKTDGVWASLDWLVLHAAHNAQAGRVNARQPSKVMSAVNSPIFTVDRGYTGDGVSAYLDAGEPWQASPNYTQDAATLGSWVNLEGSTNTQPIAGIAGNGSTLMNVGTTSTLFRMNAVAGVSATTTNRLGHRAVTRSSSSTVKAYIDGALVGTNTATTSGAPSALNGCSLRGNSVYSADRSPVLYSGFFSDAQEAAMHSRLSTYFSAIGAI